MIQGLFDPNSPEFIRDPYRFYAELRRNDPFWRNPVGLRFLTRDRDVRAILNDRRFGRDFQGVTTGGPEVEATNPVFQEASIRGMRRWMLVMDPPDHSRIRALVVKAFSARRVQDMHILVQQVIDRVLASLEGRRNVDLMGDFAYRVPQQIISDLLGVEEGERPEFVSNIDGLVRLLDPVPMNRAQLDYTNRQEKILATILQRLFERRRREPRDDLITHLVQAEEAGDKLTAEELTANVMLLFVAGFETTANTIGNALLALYRQPEELARLKADFSLMPNAVEEFLRFDSAVQFTTRTALEDAGLGNIAFRKGEPAVVVLAAANRDPEVYDQPDRLDITRKNIKPMNFGGGIHHCLGNQLARMEIGMALAGLLQRFPNLKLTDVQNPRFRKTIALRGMVNLPATL
ncbi:MAG TPA: cytochrome P450 [Dongiaceae bacterium]